MKEGTDPFGELVDGCRKMGMVVVARTDPHSILDDAATAHPEWVAVDAGGQQAAALGDAGAVGDVRAGAVQLRVHDGGDAGDRPAVQGGRRLLATGGRGAGSVTASRARRNFGGSAGWSCRGRRTSAGSGVPQLGRVEQRAAVRAVAAVGRGDPQGEPAGAVHRQLRRRVDDDAGHADDRGDRADALRRPAVAPRADAAVGEREERQGVPRRRSAASRSSASRASASTTSTGGRTR